MEKKLKITIFLGYLLIIVFIILLNIQSVFVNILGNKTFKLGNKTVTINNTPETRLISNPDSIKKYINLNNEFAFLIIDDSTEFPVNKVFIDYLRVEGFTKYEQIIELLGQDTTGTIVKKEIVSDALLIKQKVVAVDGRILYLYSRYNNCFPYFLRIRTAWSTYQDVPPKIAEIFNSVQVK